MKTTKLSVGVVGLQVGQEHVTDYLASNSVGEVVICDLNERRLNETGDKYGIKKRYADFTHMLSREHLDAVSIALPNKLHLPATLQAIEAGCHVLCEKPMGRTAAEAEKMLEAAKRHGKKLMINFSLRPNPVVQAVKTMVDAGKLGNVYFARTLWVRRRGVPWWYPLDRAREMCGGGPVIDIGVHVLDRAMWMCGFPEPEWVLGNTFCQIAGDEAKQRGLPGFDLEDMGVAMIRMRNGMMMELEASWASNRENEEITTQLYGSKGGVLITHIVGGPDKEELYWEIDGHPCNVKFDQLPPMPGIRQLFLDAILNDTDVLCTPEQGVIINRILDAVYQSAETGAPVKMDET